MVKAQLTLPNGTEIAIDGTPEEVEALLNYYGLGDDAPTPPGKSKSRKKSATKRSATKKTTSAKSSQSAKDEASIDLTEVVNLVKNCDEAEAIETQILDRASQVERVLLPLYIVHKHLENKSSLSSGDITKVLTDLGVPIAQPNVSRTLSGTASKYVMGDGVRKKGAKIAYKLSRRGTKYMTGVIGGSDED